jgi:hypothetical protein
MLVCILCFIAEQWALITALIHTYTGCSFVYHSQPDPFKTKKTCEPFLFNVKNVIKEGGGGPFKE